MESGRAACRSNPHAPFGQAALGFYKRYKWMSIDERTYQGTFILKKFKPIKPMIVLLKATSDESIGKRL